MRYIHDSNHNGNLGNCEDSHSQSHNNNNMKQNESKNKLCWFGLNCFRQKCDFNHELRAFPPRCRFDLRCWREDCHFKHSDDCKEKSSCVDQNCNSRHANRNQNVHDISDRQPFIQNVAASRFMENGNDYKDNSCVNQNCNDRYTNLNMNQNGEPDNQQFIQNPAAKNILCRYHPGKK